MSIRHATMADLDKISAIEAECFPKAEAATKESFKARLTAYPEYFWVIEENGKMIGFLNGPVINKPTIDDEMYSDASCHNKNNDWQTVFGINTLPEYRKQGFGGKLLNEMIKTAKNEGRKGCVLTCKDYLVHYYESFGFVRRGVSASSHGGAKWNDLVLEF